MFISRFSSLDNFQSSDSATNHASTSDQASRHTSADLRLSANPHRAVGSILSDRSGVEAHEQLTGMSELALCDVCTSILPSDGALSNNLPSRIYTFTRSHLRSCKATS